MRSLIEHGSIKTTLPKAKELRPKMEKLITMAIKGDLANRRRVIAKLDDIAVGNNLVDVIAPQIKAKRSSGYLRVVKLDEWRTGDNAPMGRVEFVDSIKTDAADEPAKEPAKSEAKAAPAKKQPAAPAKASAGQAEKTKKESK
jgi:large subunit ribosomal protein L17